MTTPETSDAMETHDMTDSQRMKRTPPVRTPPIRKATPAPAATVRAAPTPADPTGNPSPADGTVSDAVAQMVRLGYDVLAQNIQEARTAASQFRVGEYNIREAPGDLNQLATRMLRLTRELSSTTFDLMDRVLNDPALLGAIAAHPTQPAPATGYQADGPATAPPTPKMAASPIASAAASNAVALTCRFTGAKSAVMTVATLTQPDTPTTLKITGLESLETSSPAIEGVTFSPADNGSGVVADITIKDDQPAGLYSGIVFSAVTHLPLGTLTIQVLQ